MCGTREPFLPSAAMVVVVVMPVVFVLRLLKSSIKTPKLAVSNRILLLLLCIVKHIAIHVTQIVAWPEPKSLWSNGTPAYWVFLESSCHGKNN